MVHWLLSLIFVAECAAWHWLWLRLLARDGSLGRVERHGAALTFQIALWTLVLTALGFLGVMFAPVTLAVMAAGGAAVFFLTKNEPEAVPAEVMSFDAAHYIAGGFLAIAAICAGCYLWLGVRLPVVDYDGLSYHLSMAVHMAQDGDFRYYAGESGYVNHFARGGELLMALSIQLAGSLRFVNVAQWIMLPVLLCSVWGAVRGFGAGRPAAMVAAAMSLVAPVILYQSKMAYADLFSAGWFAVGVCAVLGAATRAVSPVRVFWMFVAAGLCVGAKHNGAPLAVVLGLAALVAWGPGVFFAGRRRLAATAAALGVSLLIGLPWMARNLANWGSPIFPFAVEIGEREIFPGDLPMEATKWMASDLTRPELSEWDKLWVTFTNLDFESRRRVGWFGGGIAELSKGELLDESWGMRGDRKDTGFGAVWLLAGLPGLIVLAVLALWRRPWLNLHDNHGRLRRFAGVLVAAVVVALWITTSAWWARFALYIVPLGAVAVGVLVGFFRVRARQEAQERIQTSDESAPAKVNTLLPGYFAASTELQIQYSRELEDIFWGESGANVVDAEFGLRLIESFDGLGYYRNSLGEVERNLSFQCIYVDGDRESLRCAMAAKGFLKQQEMVGATKAIEASSIEDAGSLTILLGRKATIQEFESFAAAVGHSTGWKEGVFVLPLARGLMVRRIDEDWVPLSKSDVRSAAIMAVETVFDANGTFIDDANLIWHESEGEAVFNNWKEDQNGEAYQRTISEAGRSDSLARLVIGTSHSVESLQARYAREHEWDSVDHVRQFHERVYGRFFAEVSGSRQEDSIATGSNLRQPALFFILTYLAIPFLYDASAALFLNRDGERLVRYAADTGGVSQTPIDWFLWADPGNPMWRAVGELMRAAEPGETVSAFSPDVVIFNGLLHDGDALVRSYPFPSFYPFPKNFPPERVIALLEDKGVRLFLTGPAVDSELLARLPEVGAMERFRADGFVVWELPFSKKER